MWCPHDNCGRSLTIEVGDDLPGVVRMECPHCKLTIQVYHRNGFIIDAVKLKIKVKKGKHHARNR